MVHSSTGHSITSSKLLIKATGENHKLVQGGDGE